MASRITSVDMPDVIDSGGSKDLTTKSGRNALLAKFTGTLVAAAVVTAGVGAWMMLRNSAESLPVVGQLFAAGRGQTTPGWEGM